MNHNVRRITDGAMMIAIVGALLLIDRQLGNSLSYMFMFVLPLPMIMYSARYGGKESWTVFAALVFVAFIVSTPSTIFYVASESLIGLFYGSGIKKKVSSHRLLIMTMLLSVVIQLVDLVIIGALIGYGVTEQVAELSTMLSTTFETAGVELADSFLGSQFLVTLVLVASAALGIMQGFVTNGLARILLKRFHYDVEPNKPLSAYFPPKWTGYVALFGFIAYYYIMIKPIDNELAGYVILAVGMFGYMYLLFFGMIFIMLMMQIRNPKSKAASVFVSLLLMFMIPQALMFAGFLYITTDTHRRLMEGSSYAEENK